MKTYKSYGKLFYVHERIGTLCHICNKGTYSLNGEEYDGAKLVVCSKCGFVTGAICNSTDPHDGRKEYNRRFGKK